jgi:hypothetical protein
VQHPVAQVNLEIEYCGLEGRHVRDVGNELKKTPERVRGLPHFLAGSVRSQAAIVPAFFCMISASARSQSSSSWPS